MSFLQNSAPHPADRDGVSEQFRADVLRGLRAAPKELPCKYFYDQAGSELFERITELEEYYLTRTEWSIMTQHAADMAGLLGRRCLLIEYGSGSSTKTRILLHHLREPAGYVPVDVAADFLYRSIAALSQEFPDIEVLPLCADFTQPIQLPVPRTPAARRVVYFPGSTIGNFTRGQSVALMRRTAALCGPGGALLLGVDLQKDPQVIRAAYNDKKGVTAAFNRNILVRINRELSADFVVDQFAHQAVYDTSMGRIEMHLISRSEQCVRLGETAIAFTAGESIRTEYSYKYSLSGLRDLAESAGFTFQRAWMDERKYFAVVYLTVPATRRP